MTDQEILDNAPKGANEVYFFEGVHHYATRYRAKRSLADIRRIVELESKLVKSVTWGVYHFTAEELAIRDLEQQAKGVDEFVAECKNLLDWDWSMISAYELFDMMRIRAKELREQAKKLGGDL